MRTQICAACFILATGWMVLTTPLMAASSETRHTIQRMVRGTVVTTNVKDAPHTIVVRVILPSKEELIVGASVPPNVGITRGLRAISLSDIKAGDVADVTYTKNPDGLVARSIHVR